MHPQDERPGEGFNAAPYLMQMPKRKRGPNGQWIDGQEDYLEVKWRLLWLRTNEPEAGIETEILYQDGDRFIVKAKVTLHSGGFATGISECTRAEFARGPLEKAETGAIGRALGALGFGTQFCGNDFDEDIENGGKLADAPVSRGGGLAQAAEDLGLHREQQAQTTTALLTRQGNGERQLSAAQERFLATLRDQVKNLINEKDTDYLEVNEWCKEKFGVLYDGNKLSIDQLKMLVPWLSAMAARE